MKQKLSKKKNYENAARSDLRLFRCEAIYSLFKKQLCVHTAASTGWLRAYCMGQAIPTEKKLFIDRS